MNEFIIGVDTGNRCIKTANHVFVAGLKTSDQKPPFTPHEGLLKYKDRYYMLSNDRIAYLQDKTESDEYFVLSLFAIAKELITRQADLDKTLNVALGLGLPPSHLPRLRKKFEKYFDRGVISFEYNSTPITIDIKDILVVAQGYAAIYMDYEKISRFDKSYIVDIGGYTTDVISLTNGNIDSSFYESIDMGLIHLFNNIMSEAKLKYGHVPSESQVDEMMKTGREISPKYPMLDIVNAEATKYIEELMRKLSEYKVDLVFSKGVFVGGGSERFKEWIERSDYVLEPYFVLNVHANAQGYESLIKFQRETAKNS